MWAVDIGVLSNIERANSFGPLAFTVDGADAINPVSFLALEIRPVSLDGSVGSGVRKDCQEDTHRGFDG